ncbi:PLAC8 family-domain-containing protein [Mycena floridula]|nr:PLAC8 family-domain-containing protein [Mycena floridula]
MSYQEKSQSTMTVTNGGNRNPKNLPFGEDGTREWSSGLFDCFDDAGTCFTAWCCPCIVYGQNKQRLDHLAMKGYPDPEHGGCCTGDCMIHALASCCGFGCILACANRGSIRARYRIQGGSFGDFFSAWCCAPCELTQESQELLLEERSFGQQ